MVMIAGEPFTQLTNLNVLDTLRVDGKIVKGLTNVIPVNSLADLPDPDGNGEIELTNGLSIVYELGSVDVDLGSNVLIQTGGECVIRGSNRFESRLTTSSTKDLITVTNGAFACEFVAVTCPNSTYFLNFTSTPGFNSLIMQNMIYSAVKSIARIDGAFTTSLRTCTSVVTTVGGIDWIGANNSQINCTNFLGLGGAVGWVGTLFNLGTATFDLIVITSDNRFVSKAGNTILGGQPANANLKVGGRALVNGSIFNGVGTALSGIDEQDIQWSFGEGNIGVDQSVEIGVGNITASIVSANAGLGVMSPVLATTVVAGPDISRFTLVSLGTNRFGLRYDGIRDIQPKMDFRYTVTKTGGTANEVEVETRISTDGGTVFTAIDSNSNGFVDATNRRPGGSSQVRGTMKTNDIIEIYQANNDSGSNAITFLSMNVDIK